MNREQPMMRGLAAISALLAAALWASEANAWASANRFGGATQHSWGETSHENRWGGSTEHVAGEGTEHTNVYGGTTAGRYGEGAYHAGPAGAAYRPPGYAAYPAYHPPAVVPAYSAGCYGCVAAAGAIVGVAADAAVASASTAAATTNAYAAGVATGSANAAAATTSAYNAGVAAGAAGATYAMGVNYATLPAGSSPVTVAGATYYLSGNTWFKPMFGANGVYYQVVPTP